jgi:hypothetical protein
MDEWFHSDKVKRNFILLVVGHIVIWILTLVGIVCLYGKAQQTARVEAYTATGEPAFGTPVNDDTPQAAQKKEEFLTQHLRHVISYLFTRTEKGVIPELRSYTDDYCLARIDYDFARARKSKKGYSQTFYIQDFENIMGGANSSRRVYRVHGLLNVNDMNGVSNTPVYLLVAVDKREPTNENAMGWFVTTVITLDPKDYYNKERQALIEEATKPQETTPATPKTPQTSKK